MGVWRIPENRYSYRKHCQNTNEWYSGVKLSTLHYIEVDVEGRQCKRLVDSGAEICLISEELASEIHADECGHIGVRGIFSDPIRLPLMSVNIKRGGGSNYDNVADGVHVVCAIAPLKETSHSVVLSSDVVADLVRMRALNVMCVKVQSCDNDVEYQSCNTCVNDCMVTEVDAGNDDDDDDESTVSVPDNANDVADSNKQSIKAQHDDTILASCWEMAKVNKGNYVVDHGILFHYDQVEGQKVCQLCVPKYKRNAVLQLAHDSVFGGHLAQQPLLSGDDDDESRMSASVGRVVHRVCMSKVSSGDVVAVADCGCACEAEYATHTVERDADHVICKRAVNAENVQNALHVLQLLLVLLLLVTFTGRAVCDARVGLFANVQVPSKIVSDNCTNFSSPVFATPGHPQASGLVESINVMPYFTSRTRRARTCCFT